MDSLKRSLVVMYVLSIWTIAYARDCGDQQTWINERCCDLCPPGDYVNEFCTDHKQTVCNSCENGSFSDHYSIFDRCKECQSCQHEYAEKCTPTRNAICSCHSGFLCSNNVCSTCEENKCITGEKLKRTDISKGGGLIEYLYQCEPACSGRSYFDVRESICKPWTQCSAFGLAELYPGNKTHNSVCDVKALMHSKDRDSTHIILGISFGLLSLSFLVILSFARIKNLRKRKANNNPVLTVSTNMMNLSLSKEESGVQLIIQDESKDNNSFEEQHLSKVTNL